MAFTFLRQHFKRNVPKMPPQNQHPPPPPTSLHPPPLPPLDFSSNQEPLTDDASIGSEALSDGERSAENTPPPDGEQDSGVDSGSNFSQQESSTSPTDKDPESCEETSLCSATTQSSDNLESFHETRESEYLDTEEYSTGTLTSSGDFHDVLEVTNESPSSRCVSEISGEERDADENVRPSPDDDLGELDRKSASSEDLEDESKTSLSEIQSPQIPPPPPLPGLRFMGDHTTSSTTDSTFSTSKQIPTANGTDPSGCKNKNLVDEIRAAAGQQHSRKMSNSMEMFPVPTSKRLSMTINDDIKAVLVARQAKLEQSAVDFEVRLPKAKSTFYQARIGVAPEDTELGRLFRKRAEKLLAQPSVEPRTGFDAVQPVDRDDDEQVKASTEVSSSTIQDYKYGENLEDRIDETAEDDMESDDDTIRQSSLHEIEDGDALSESEFPENPSGNQEIQPPHDDKSVSETQNEENEDDFNAVVKDLDQLLLENSSSSNLALSTEYPSVSSPSSSSGYFEMASGSSSPSDFPELSPNSLELSPNSFGSDCVFDDDVITNSAEVVREHSKLLSQPLESYNILPGITTQTGNSPNSVPKRSFTFRNLMQSFRKSFRAPTAAVAVGKPDIVAPTVDGKLEFDDNWSIHDTIREKEKVSAPRSLQDVFGASGEVRSLSEFVDSTRDTGGKDFSVRNWQDVLERSSYSGGGPEDQAWDALAFLGSSRSSSGKSKKSSKSRTTTEVLDDISSNLSSTGSQRLRLASSGLNSTLPSCRNHVIMQSLDSIFPVSHQGGQRHYQKQHKYSLTAIASNALLSPVVRRQQRNQKK